MGTVKIIIGKFNADGVKKDEFVFADRKSGLIMKTKMNRSGGKKGRKVTCIAKRK